MLKLYKKQFGLLFFISILSFNFNSLNAQCAFGSNTIQSPAATFTPVSDGVIAAVTTCNFGGDFFLMNVVSGNTYIVETCGGTWDSQITIYNDATQVQLGYNDDGCGLQSTVTFVANFTGVVRVLINQFNCTTNTTCITTNVTSTSPPVNNDCASVVPSALTSPGSLTFTGTSSGSTDNTVSGSLGTPQVWEAFTITECANVTINTCGTAPIFTEMFTVISNACPADFPSTFISASSFDFTTCADGNSTAVFTNLAPGTYYVPVIGSTPNNHAYTLNISSEDFIPEPVITPASSTTICIGGSVQLDVTEELGPDVQQTVTGGAAITIPSSGNSTPFPSGLTVSGLPTSGITVFSVNIDGISHTFSDDIDMWIVSPTNQSVMLMSDVGGLNDFVNSNFVIQDGAAAFSDNGANPSGTYSPTDFVAGDVGAPAGYTTSLASLTGDYNGSWGLFIRDDLGGDLGSVTSWSITFNVPGSPLTYTWTPATGLNVATGISVIASPTVSTTYTVTASTPSSSCTNSQTVDVIVTPLAIPTFTQVPAICSGATLAALPIISNNGISGTWAPALNNSATTLYTFTPTAGQCADIATMTITVNPNVTPTFTQVAAICSGAVLGALPTPSNNAVTGSWSPAPNNTTTTLYTFTPTAGLCATTATMTITVNPSTTPTFTQVAAICSGEVLGALPTPSNNGVTGSWSPAPNNTATTLYTFTPTAGLCATTATMTITVNPNVTPTFTQVAPICLGGTLNALPTPSNNGIAGSWSPAPNNTTTTLYTFTPTAGLCATTATMTISVNFNTVPTFTQIAPICSGGSFTLPNPSDNAISGSWSPVANNTATTTYTFTPNAGQCAVNTTMTVTVNPNVAPTFTQVTPICSGGSFTLPNPSNNSITGSWLPVANNTATTTYTFTPTAGQCASTGTMTVTVNPNVTPTFTQVNPICTGGSITLPNPSNNAISGSWSPAINNTATTTYTFTPTAGQCANTATMTVTVNSNVTPSFTQIAPICTGGLLTLPTTSTNSITGLWSPAANNTATTAYTFTPTAGQCALTTTMTVTVNSSVTPTFTQVAPICSGGSITLPNPSNNSITGSWSPAVNNTATTLYTFTPTAGQCATTATMTATVNPNVTPTFTQISPICSGGVINLPISSTNGISGSWSPAVNNTATTLYTFTPTAGQCATIATMTVVVTPTAIPTFTAIAPICSGGTFSLSAISNNGIFGSWTPAFDNTVTTTYTFTPLAVPGQCSTPTTMTITVNPSVTPTFTQVSPICAGATLAALPLTSTNGVPGTWSPALNSSATTTYTFTPTAGQCATSATMTIVVNPNVTPNFTQIPAICSGGIITLPISSPNGIVGSWSPAPNNTASTTYTFTPTVGQCATTTTMTIVVNPNITPTFTQVGTVCFGASFTLPTPSNNGITGTWAPAPNNTSTSSYLFTPTTGQCATFAFMGVTVVPNVIPTFNPIAPICSGASLSLPVASTNGIVGTWSPAINNTATTTYTFTPSVGQCAVTTTLTVTVTPNVTPTFAAILPICSGAVLAPLPSPSDNGISGTWSPVLNNTVTTTYTFTPDAGICATSQTLTITVNPNVIPNFVQVAPICVGGTLTALPNTSPNGVTGNWFPALNNTATTTYTFTPTIGLCATPATMTIVVNPIITPTFSVLGPICSGANLTLPTTSNESNSGTWSPAVNNTATTTYTFTPDAGQCAVSTTMTVTVTPNVTPIFASVSPICAGATLAPLQVPSDNGIIGTWSPALDNTTTTTYTFTPTVGVCATTQILTITVNPNVTPNFAQVAPICVGGTLAPLPIISTNGISGTWSPALDNTQTTTYTFSPTTGLCATTTIMTIVVNPIVTPTFNPIAAICEGASLILPNSSIEGITGTWTPAVNNLATTTYTFTPDAGQCALTTTLSVAVTPNVPTLFTQVSPICSGTSLILPTPSDNGITGTWSPSPNNTTTTTYTFTPTTGVCATSETMTVTVTPNVTPTFASVAPICVGGTIAPLPSPSTNGIPGTWSPALDNTQTTTYTFAPSSGICATNQTLTITVNQLTIPAFTAVTPICIGSLISALPTLSTNGINGTWSPALDNTQTTTYTFTPDANQCADVTTMTIIVNQLTPTTFDVVSPICAGSTLAALPISSNEGITGVWSPALNNTQTTIYTFTPDAGQCADVSTLTIIVNSPTLPTFAAVGPICVGNTYNLLTSSIEGITGSWSPAIDNTQTTTYTFTPDAGQCALSTTMTVSVVSASDADFTISSYCNGVGVAPVVTGLPGGVFSFNPAVSDGAVIDPLTGVIASGVAGTTYIVQYTLTGSCTVFSQELVSFVATPTTPVLSNDTTYCLTSTFVSMTSTNSGGTTSWFSDLAMTNLLGTGTNLLPSITLGTSTYYVSENLQGCLSPMDSVVVTVNDCYEFTAPSAFTPDGDGVNDSWLISELNVRYPNNNVTIFNRWGQVLYNSDGYLIPWDGRFDNKDLPVGSYYYIIDFNDALDTPNATGIVTIIRN
jgi:gliding motility-associated-like protein